MFDESSALRCRGQDGLALLRSARCLPDLYKKGRFTRIAIKMEDKRHPSDKRDSLV
jgi:hypothetical protein